MDCKALSTPELIHAHTHTSLHQCVVKERDPIEKLYRVRGNERGTYVQAKGAHTLLYLMKEVDIYCTPMYEVEEKGTLLLYC